MPLLPGWQTFQLLRGLQHESLTYATGLFRQLHRVQFQEVYLGLFVWSAHFLTVRSYRFRDVVVAL